MSEPTTDDYIASIQDAKANGHTYDINFDQLPDKVDQTKLVQALSEGLPDGYSQSFQQASDAGHTLNVDFSAVQPPADSMANHPILDTVEKTAELGGLAAGGMAGAGAGAMTSPVTGPVGPIMGSVAGAGLGYGAVKSGADALNRTLGYAPPKSLKDNAIDTTAEVGEGSKMQLYGEGAAAAAQGVVQGAKAAFPYAEKVLKTLPKPVADRLMANPRLPEQYSGTPGAIEDAVTSVQDGLKALKQKASSIYDDVLENVGLGNPKTPEEAALKASDPKTFRVLPPKDIGTAYLDLVTDPSISDADKLAKAVKINKAINATVKWAGAGQNVKPVSDDLAPTLQTVKDGVMSLLRSIPGGEAVVAADDTWHTMRQVYDTLQPNLADTGKATAWLTKVISDEGTASATTKQALQTLDAAVGKPLSEDAMNHIAVGLMKRPMADSMMGKMGMILALMHPGARLASLPILIGAQSPTVATAMGRGIANTGDFLASHSGMVAPALAGLYNGVKGLPTTNHSSMPSQRDD